jgi:protein O-mannosyl-transferase
MADKNKKKSANRPATSATTTASTKEQAAWTPVLQPGFLQQHWLPCLLLMVSAFALYAAALGYGYALDDELVFGKNLFVQKGWTGIGEIFANDSFLGYFQKKEDLFRLEGGRYRPLSLVTFAMEVGLFGKEKTGISHGINLFLYGVNGILLYRVLLGLLPVSANGVWYWSAAFWGALLFMLHPLHVECVANIKGRDEILALTLALASLYATLKYLGNGNRLWWALSGVFLLLGMLAKENVLTFVAVIPLTVWFFVKPGGNRVLSTLWPLLGAALLFILLRYQALGYMVSHGKVTTDLMNNSFLGMSASERMATIFLTLGWYIKLLFLPHPLTHDYYPYHVPKVGWGDWRVLLSFAMYAAMIVWAVMNLRKRPLPAYAILFFVLTLSIVSNIAVPVGSFMNERFVYMPSVAFCMLAGWFITQKLPELLKQPIERPAIAGGVLALLFVAGYVWRTVTRVPAWENALSLNTAAVQVSEGSARAHCFYVTALYSNKYEKAHTKAEKAPIVAEMTEHLNKAFEIYPRYGSAWMMQPHIAAAAFEIDNDFGKMLTELERGSDNPNSIGPVLQYIPYYASKGLDQAGLASLCYRMGYNRFYKERRDYATAIKYLETGIKIGGGAPMIKAAAEVYRASGNTAKANALESQ